MQRRFFVLALLGLFFVISVAIYAIDVNNGGSSNLVTDRRPGEAKLNLFSGSDGPDASGVSTGKIYLGPQISNTVAPARQFFTTVTTRRDRQHYTCPERQIVYAGYYNAAAKYIYMDYSNRAEQPAVINDIKYGIFNWAAGGAYNGNWYLPTGVGTLGDGTSNTCNVDATPDNGWSVISYHGGADAESPFYSQIGYAGTSPTNAHSMDSMPWAVPVSNVNGITQIPSGYCGDQDAINTPFVWPCIDVDTNSSGMIITHAGAMEATCATVPTGAIEVGSVVYYRKVSTVHDEPWSGNWEGPYFMDSIYVISPIVRADKSDNRSSKVYFAYLKPIYYYYGPGGAHTHYCTNGTGHYQITNEVVYWESNNDGAVGSWTGPIKVTDYASGFTTGHTDPAVYDLTGMVDEDGVFHLAWSTNNRDPDDPCTMLYGAQMWHWDNNHNCISLAYDASHPAYFRAGSDQSAWNITIAKHNISICDGKLYISFTRYGAHATGDTANPDYGRNDGTSPFYLNGDIMVVASDLVGSSWLGKTWSGAKNLTDTETDTCTAGTCESENWPTMAMFMHDSLMIEYIRDRDPGEGASTNDPGAVRTDNPIMFMTWPCFTMAQAGLNRCYSKIPVSTVYPEIALAPNGITSGCTTPANYQDTVTLQNCGNTDLAYTSSSNAAWLVTIPANTSGTVSAGTGPRGANSPSWAGAPGCATPSIVIWKASSGSPALPAGNYTGKITVNFTDPLVSDFDIEVHLVVACQYYLAEYATLQGGCWTVDVFNTPQAGNGSERNVAGHAEGPGNMSFYACQGDSTYHPLYKESIIIGWIEGKTVKAYTDNSAASYGKRMRALGHVTTSSVGSPASGTGYWKAEGLWCTPDSAVYGKTEYFVPGHQDTAVLIEKITIWNKKAVILTNFLVAEGIDWDIRRDSNFDVGGFDQNQMLLYQRGARKDDSVCAGLSPYVGGNSHHGGLVVPNKIYIYDDTGYNPPKVYDTLMALADNTYALRYNDSAQDLNCLHKFWAGTLGVTDTLVFIKIKTISLNGVVILKIMIANGKVFIKKYPTIYPYKVVVSKDTLKFSASPGGVNPPNQTFNITEEMGAPMGWAAVKAQPWLTILPIAGVAPSQITVSVNITGLPVGIYEDDITITAPGATNSPKKVHVKLTIAACQGRCGDANQDGAVNVSDAVWIINYVFAGGPPPKPVTACGDANADGSSNVSDAVWIINYVFAGGGPPTDCKPSAWIDKCCPF